MHDKEVPMSAYVMEHIDGIEENTIIVVYHYKNRGIKILVEDIYASRVIG